MDKKYEFCRKCHKRLDCKKECGKYLADEFERIEAGKEKEPILVELYESSFEEIWHNTSYDNQEIDYEKVKTEYINLRLKTRSNGIFVEMNKASHRMPYFNPSKYFSSFETKIGNTIIQANGPEEILLQAFRTLKPELQTQAFEYIQTLLDAQEEKIKDAKRELA